MDMSGEVAEIHMRTDAKNLVIIVRIIYSLKQEETIHMISMLRKEACSGSIHDLANTSTQNCLAVCLTKAEHIQKRSDSQRRAVVQRRAFPFAENCDTRRSPQPRYAVCAEIKKRHS